MGSIDFIDCGDRLNGADVPWLRPELAMECFPLQIKLDTDYQNVRGHTMITLHRYMKQLCSQSFSASVWYGVLVHKAEELPGGE